MVAGARRCRPRRHQLSVRAGRTGPAGRLRSCCRPLSTAAPASPFSLAKTPRRAWPRSRSSRRPRGRRAAAWLSAPIAASGDGCSVKRMLVDQRAPDHLVDRRADGPFDLDGASGRASVAATAGPSRVGAASGSGAADAVARRAEAPAPVPPRRFTIFISDGAGLAGKARHRLQPAVHRPDLRADAVADQNVARDRRRTRAPGQ